MQPNNHYCVTGMNVNELKPNMILHSLRACAGDRTRFVG